VIAPVPARIPCSASLKLPTCSTLVLIQGFGGSLFVLSLEIRHLRPGSKALDLGRHQHPPSPDIYASARKLRFVSAVLRLAGRSGGRKGVQDCPGTLPHCKRIEGRLARITRRRGGCGALHLNPLSLNAMLKYCTSTDNNDSSGGLETSSFCRLPLSGIRLA
jgi:hypothetical protein